MGAPRDFSLTFAGAGERLIRAAGRHVRVQSCDTTGVYIRVENGSELFRNAGDGINVSGGFTYISIRVTVACTVYLILSDDRQDQDSQTVTVNVNATVAASSTMANPGDVSIAATTSAQVAAASASQLAVTIQAAVANTATLRVGAAGVGAASGLELAPGDVVTFATKAAVHAYNPAGVAQSVCVVSQDA